MLRLQAIHGNNQVETPQVSPFQGDRANCTRNELHLDAHGSKLWKQHLQLAVTDQWFPAHNGKVKRSKASNQSQDTCDQIFAFVIVEPAQRADGLQVNRFVGVAARTAEGTFPGNFE